MLGAHRMMFRPRESHDLRLVKARLEITQQPAHLRFLHDVFDNSVGIASFDGHTAELHFESVVVERGIGHGLPMVAELVLLIPRISATATTMPDAADQKLCVASPTISVK